MAVSHTPDKNPLLIVIAGPTAVGKTAVAIEVAKQLGTVILSADSRQCFKELNIGVARPSTEELNAVPHYFIASHSIHDAMSAAIYEAYALDLLEQLFDQYPVIVVTGGTGLYIKALLDGMDPIPSIPEELRKRIIAFYNTNGIEWLKQELQLKDPLFAARGEMQNPRRMMRALEVMESTGRSILEYQSNHKAERFFNSLCIGLELPRAMLYERIDQRVYTMMAAGLEEEVKSLRPLRTANALQTVGYQELFHYFDGMLTKDQAIHQIQRNTRHYAKRQLTWFKKQAAFHWLDATAAQSVILPFIQPYLPETKK
ncbi:tRNA (adenosine(37)-N6)-dimethylallyltransferase MiaA [Niabella ginsenosidivorans]|uniref:tRNA dimethylallyltransferase n=1 Tax=Niabella ginsenosidivorans TaxID=1176587 RepID=A0A1A9I4K5_9BACT|nr:tRNA (adenosine(37)-N6)-dimethylallyltransferase MiaA [Niabella ginsenosidivorans]ANH82608.1 tRNA (adenosine(37)-N6)-dimethylallyltransferase MiaA [Niabella ginsenosidivorans]